MKRTTFMQWLMALPLFPKNKPRTNVLPKDVMLNGTVWSSPTFLSHTVIVLFMDAKDGVVTFALLSKPYRAASYNGGHNGTAMMMCHYDENTYGGKWSGIYSEDELRKKLSKWTRRPELDLHLWNTEKQELDYFL